MHGWMDGWMDWNQGSMSELHPKLLCISQCDRTRTPGLISVSQPCASVIAKHQMTQSKMVLRRKLIFRYDT